MVSKKSTFQIKHIQNFRRHNLRGVHCLTMNNIRTLVSPIRHFLQVPEKYEIHAICAQIKMIVLLLDSLKPYRCGRPHQL